MRAADAVASCAYQKADIVFITDGQAPISYEFLTHFIDLKKKKEFRVFCVLIQSMMTDTLKMVSDEIVEVAELLDSEAEILM